MRKFFILFLALLLISSCSAFMPLEHYIITEKAIQSSSAVDTDFYNSCRQYPNLCAAGNMEVDVGVIWYYTASGKYGALHSPTFCKELLDNVAKVPGADPNKMKACAVGGCLHLPQDVVSHGDNGLVQYSILHSFLPNEIIHVFAEQHLDNWVRKNDVYAANEYKSSLLEGYIECQPLFIQAMQGDAAFAGMSEAQLKSTFDTFVTEIVNSQTGYDAGFKNKSFFVTIKSIPLLILIPYILISLGFVIICLLLAFKIFSKDRKIKHFIGLSIFLPTSVILIFLLVGSLFGSAFNNFIKIISPISNLVPIGDKAGYMEQALKNSVSLLLKGETFLEGTDPSGLGTNPVLIQASKSTQIFSYIFLTIVLLSLIIFIWYLFKGDRSKS